MVSKKIQVKGIVQGVGFRPYVYNLALKYDIKGWVNNDDKGVNILLYSEEKAYENFINELKNNPPKLSKIDEISIEEITKIIEYKSFEIIKSETTNNKVTIISPDMSICEDCLEDINDKNNFRYNYALTNCTNCGPRYSIIKTVPYDRCNTSMENFEFCKKCKEEYENPRNRRYHAQPVSCEKCGPNVSLYNNNGKEISNDIEAIKSIADFIKKGHIVAIKGVGGFHLVCDATNEKAIRTLRLKKNRKTKPFAVVFEDLKSVKAYTKPSFIEEEVLCSKEKPIVLLKKKKDFDLSEQIAPNIDILGCFIAYTPLHHLLFRYLDNPIIATSANLKDEPIIRFKDEIIEKLGFMVDYVLDFNREIINTCDDSIIQIINDKAFLLRNARGYAPTHIKLEKNTSKKILCLGANQKSTISLVFENNLILSPYIGDLSSIKSLEYFERTIETFKRFYDFEPDIIVCDLHPLYESTKYAKLLKEKNPKLELIQVQHHYAHLLSTMVEYKLSSELLGFVFDGTGYGDDRHIWGGEVFLANNKNYKRVKHLKYFKLLGGEIAVREPKRVALSLLFDNYTLEEVENLDLALIKQFTKGQIKQFHTMWEKGLNVPLTSSMGRLFDAVASLCDILHLQTYEGETGLLVESFYDETIKDSFSFEILEDEIDITLMIKELIYEKDKKVVCSKFINTLVNIILEVASNYKTLPIILSGGVFQNRVLIEKLLEKLKSEGREVYYSNQIPINDSGVSVGQAYFTL